MAIHNTTTTTNYVVQWDDSDPNNQSQGMPGAPLLARPLRETWGSFQPKIQSRAND